MTPNEILTALAAQDGLPRQAMAAAGERREEMIPIILDQIDRLLEAQTDALLERDVASFLFVYFLLGEWRDVRAYRPLTLLLRKDPALLDLLLGDAITEGTSRVIGGVCDGDIGPICAVIEDPAADEFVRSAMFNSLVIVAREQPTLRPEIASYMERFPVIDVAKPELLWGAWAFAVADLGLDHMEAQVREAFDAGRISPDEADFALFEAELQKSKAQDGAEVDPPSRELTLIENAIDELAGWHSFSDAYLRALTRSQLDDDDLSAHWGDTFQREAPKVGRNDPCPCGSGKKFKKCCLQ